VMSRDIGTSVKRCVPSLPASSLSLQ